MIFHMWLIPGHSHAIADTARSKDGGRRVDEESGRPPHMSNGAW